MATATRAFSGAELAALCALCEGGAPDELDPRAFASPRARLGDLLVTYPRPYAPEALHAVDALLDAEAANGVHGHAGPATGRLPTRAGLQAAIWLPPIGETRLCMWRGDMRR